jgi:hypothetical protein
MVKVVAMKVVAMKVVAMKVVAMKVVEEEKLMIVPISNPTKLKLLMRKLKLLMRKQNLNPLLN